MYNRRRPHLPDSDCTGNALKQLLLKRETVPWEGCGSGSRVACPLASRSLVPSLALGECDLYSKWSVSLEKHHVNAVHLTIYVLFNLVLF